MADEYPNVHFPTVFADGVASVSNSASVVKFYLYRQDPSFNADGTSTPTSMAQVIMPMEGFAATALFFERRLKNYIEAGFITEKRLAEMREVLSTNEQRS